MSQQIPEHMTFPAAAPAPAPVQQVQEPARPAETPAEAFTRQAPEQPQTFDPHGFDLADWITGGTAHRLRERVTIYRDANLAAEINDVEARIKAAENRPEGMDAVGESGPSALEQEKQELIRRFDAAKATVEVVGLIESEIAEIDEATGKTIEDGDPSWWYQALSRAATVEGRALTPDQWRALHGTIGMQLNLVLGAYTRAARADVTAAFRR